MPTVLRSGPYRLFFYSNEPTGEPPHVHVERDDAVAKVWLETASFAGHRRFPAKELGRILDIVRTHRTDLLKAWHDFFGAS